MNQKETLLIEHLVPQWVPQDLFPYTSHYVLINECKIHYVDEGQGQVLLLLHGNPTWSFLYRDIIRQLSPYFRCIAIDYPGFGLSKANPGYDFKPESHARIVAEFIEKLDLKNILLMVQDWGGPIGLSVATQASERFTGLIIGNTWAWLVNGDLHFELFSKFFGGTIGRFLIRNFNAFTNVLIPLGTPKRKLSKKVMTAYRGPFATRASREPIHVFPREIINSMEFLGRLESSLPKIQHIPTLIVWGDKDIAFREKERVRFESIFRNHTTVSLKGAGHYIQEDAPYEIVESIKNWRGII